MGTDYCAEALNFNLSINREFNAILFEQMEIESEFIMSCLESMEIVMEEVQNDTAKRGVFQKIIAFIKHVFKMFADKTQAMIERDKAWMDQNGSKLDSISYDGLEIEMIPFWTMGLNRVQADSRKLNNKIMTILRNDKQVDKYKDLNAVKQDLFSEYLDENGDLTNGLKNFMRVGNANGPIKPVALRENDLKNMIAKEFRKYCADYGSVTLPIVRKIAQEAENQLTMIEKSLASKQPATEAYCLIEGALYSQTDISYYTKSIVLEADQPAANNNNNQSANQNAPQQNNQANNQQNQQKKQTVTKVQVTDHGSKDRMKQQDALNQMSSNQLVFFKNVAQVSQLSVTALMTAFEERYLAYMNAMKQIVSARGKQAQQQAAPKEKNQTEENPQKKPGIKDRIKNAVQRKK